MTDEQVTVIFMGKPLRCRLCIPGRGFVYEKVDTIESATYVIVST